MKQYVFCIVLWMSAVQASEAESVPGVSSLVTVPPEYQNASEAAPATPRQKWFADISDPLLNDIITKLLQHNATINGMLATIDRFRAEYGIVQSNRYPSANVDVTGGAYGSKVQTDSYYGMSVPVSYELDVWGRLRAQRQASLSDVTVATEDKAALTMTLVAEAMEAYYRGLYLLDQAGLLTQAVRTAEEIKEVKQRQYDAGLVAKDDVLGSEKDLREFSSALADVHAQRIRIEHSLKAMMGEYPEDGWLQGVFLLPANLTQAQPGLPAGLVEQRPDIRAQQAKLEGTGFRIAAARRDLYPKLTLTALGIKSSLESQQLIDGIFGSWAAFARVSIPLFDGGRKSSGVKVEESRYRQELQEYKGVILQAFKEVEDALAQGEKQAAIVSEIKKHEDALEGIYELGKARYDRGLENALAVQEPRLNALRARMERKKAELKLLSQRIQLLRALGGEW